jgi:hypothetical protein
MESGDVLKIRISDFDVVSDFDIRVSDLSVSVKLIST